MITQFDKVTCKAIQDEMVAALQAVAQRHGLTVRGHGGTIGALDFVAKVRFEINDPAAATAAAKTEWDQYCSLFNLKPEHFGQSFKYGAGLYTICGLALGRSKKPIKAKSFAGKMYVFPLSSVQVALGVTPFPTFDAAAEARAEGRAEAKAS
jgi:hypothetical protein